MPQSPIFNMANITFNSIRKNKILAKKSEFTVLLFMVHTGKFV